MIIACLLFGMRDNRLSETVGSHGKGIPMIDHTGVIVADLEKEQEMLFIRSRRLRL